MVTRTKAVVLNSIQNSKLKNIVNDLYRKGAKVGNGSSMAAFRFEAMTGGLVGGKSHAIKLLNYRSALVKVLKQSLNQADKKMTRELLKDITNALRGR